VAYILPYIIYYFGAWQDFFKLPECFQEGVVGVFCAMFFSGLMLLLTALLSRLHVRLRL